MKQSFTTISSSRSSSSVAMNVGCGHYAMPASASIDAPSNRQAERSEAHEGSEAHESESKKPEKQGSRLPATHNFTHFPSHPNCVVCQQAKQRAKPAHSIQPADAKYAEKFGGVILSDHLGSQGEGLVGIHGEHVAQQTSDEATSFKASYPPANRDSQSVNDSFAHCFGTQCKSITNVRTDNGPEFIKAIKAFGLPNLKHVLTIPHSHEHNARRERENQVDENVCRALMLQRMLPYSFWSYCMVYFCHCFNIFVSARCNPEISPYEA